MNKKGDKEPAASKHKPSEKKKQKKEAPIAEKIKPAEDVALASRKKLEDQLTMTEMKMAEYKDQCIRAQADLENVRRRAERDIANAHRFGAEKLLMSLLPVIDSMLRALESPESKDPHAKAMRSGMVLTLDLLEKTLGQHGVEGIVPKKGEPFNPEFHEAMSATSDPDAKPNTIYEVMQKGYQLNGRVLRAAMVIVAK